MSFLPVRLLLTLPVNKLEDFTKKQSKQHASSEQVVLESVFGKHWPSIVSPLPKPNLHLI
eukprot:3134065-Amphidinium_carterae.1